MASDPQDHVLIQLRRELTTAFDGVVANLIQQALHAVQSDRDSWVDAHGLLDDEGAARLLGATRGVVLDLIATRGLPFIMLSPRHRRYERSALMGWIEANTERGEVAQ